MLCAGRKRSAQGAKQFMKSTLGYESYSNFKIIISSLYSNIMLAAFIAFLF